MWQDQDLKSFQACDSKKHPSFTSALTTKQLSMFPENLHILVQSFPQIKWNDKKSPMKSRCLCRCVHVSLCPWKELQTRFEGLGT
jgi:hypothetical protein